MEIIIAAIGLLVSVTSVGVSVWQVRQAREQVRQAEEQTRLTREQLRLAELQHALPKPGSAGFGLNEARVEIDDSVLGLYEGRSRDNKATKAGFKPVDGWKHVEQFTLARRGGKLTVTGRSLDPETGELRSSWSGALWKLDDDGTLFFGLELTHRGKREFGTLVATIRGSVADGFYYSGDVGSKVIYSYRAEKVEPFSEVRSERPPPAEAPPSASLEPLA